GGYGGHGWRTWFPRAHEHRHHVRVYGQRHPERLHLPVRGHGVRRELREVGPELARVHAYYQTGDATRPVRPGGCGYPDPGAVGGEWVYVEYHGRIHSRRNDGQLYGAHSAHERHSGQPGLAVPAGPGEWLPDGQDRLDPCRYAGDGRITRLRTRCGLLYDRSGRGGTRAVHSSDSAGGSLRRFHRGYDGQSVVRSHPARFLEILAVWRQSDVLTVRHDQRDVAGRVPNESVGTRRSERRAFQLFVQRPAVVERCDATRQSQRRQLRAGERLVRRHRQGSEYHQHGGSADRRDAGEHPGLLYGGKLSETNSRRGVGHGDSGGGFPCCLGRGGSDRYGMG